MDAGDPNRKRLLEFHPVRPNWKPKMGRKQVVPPPPWLAHLLTPPETGDADVQRFQLLMQEETAMGMQLLEAAKQAGAHPEQIFPEFRWRIDQIMHARGIPQDTEIWSIQNIQRMSPDNLNPVPFLTPRAELLAKYFNNFDNAVRRLGFESIPENEETEPYTLGEFAALVHASLPDTPEGRDLRASLDRTFQRAGNTERETYMENRKLHALAAPGELERRQVGFRLRFPPPSLDRHLLRLRWKMADAHEVDIDPHQEARMEDRLLGAEQDTDNEDSD